MGAADFVNRDVDAWVHVVRAGGGRLGVLVSGGRVVLDVVAGVCPISGINGDRTIFVNDAKGATGIHKERSRSQ